MPSFKYTALTGGGERVAGVAAAASEAAMIADLESRDLTPVLIEAKRERASVGRRGVSARQLGTAYTQLADLLRAGVPLLRSLQLLGRRRSTPRLAAVFREVAEEVSQGEELATSLSKREHVFRPVHVAMVRAGEKGGFLEQVLARLGTFVTAQAELRGRVLASLIYPIVLVVVGSAVLGAIFAFGVPMFRPLFERIEGGLPLVTRVVLGASSAVRGWAPLTLGVVALAVVVLWRASRREGVRRAIDRFRTRAPVVGGLTRALSAARFCRMLGTLLTNGVPMLAAMQIARDASGNVLLSEAIDKAVESVRSGEPLSKPLGESGLFEEDVVEVMSVAETANNLDVALINVSETLEGRIDRLLSTAVRLIEPLLLLMIAAVIGVVAAGLILPMTRLSAGL
ncbi:MAG: type II secretion system F family protein [Phycisphaeraceae bacterium]|nr:type II secretion system F family protein [Phycisphaeraceae bacterium]